MRGKRGVSSPWCDRWEEREIVAAARTIPCTTAVGLSGWEGLLTIDSPWPLFYSAAIKELRAVARMLGSRDGVAGGG